MQSTHSLPWLGWGRGVDGEVVSWGRGECLVSYTYPPHPYVLHLITSQPPVAAVSRCHQTHAPNESRDIAEIRGGGRRWRRRWQTFVQLRGTAEKRRCHGAPPVVCHPVLLCHRLGHPVTPFTPEVQVSFAVTTEINLGSLISNIKGWVLRVGQRIGRFWN